jgi:hypothetical protein
MKWKNEKDTCINPSYDDKMVPARVQRQELEKPRVVIYYNSRMGGVDLGDVYLISYCITKKILSKALPSFDWSLLFEFILVFNSCKKKMAKVFPGWNFK